MKLILILIVSVIILATKNNLIINIGEFMKKIYLLTMVLVLLTFGCKQSSEPDIKVDENNLILGYWVNPEYNNSGDIVSFSRADDFNQEYGFVFKSNLDFIERKNAGWCGTPPISYDNFDGDFELTDKTLKINVSYWGGKAYYQWEIISLDNKKLTIKKIKEDYKR